MLRKNKLELDLTNGEVDKKIQATKSNTVIAEGVIFKGDFDSKEPMTIHGEVQGNIKSTSDVTLSQQAKLTGNLNAENMTIAGSLEGKINCLAIAEITGKGKIEGDLKANRFIMSEDGVFEGNLSIHKQASNEKPLKAA